MHNCIRRKEKNGGMRKEELDRASQTINEEEAKTGKEGSDTASHKKVFE